MMANNFLEATTERQRLVSDVSERKRMKHRIFVPILFLSLLFGGCRNTSDTQMAQPQRTSMEVSGMTVKGVVVTRSTGQALYYRKKCESCGFLSPQTDGTATPAPFGTCTVTFVCPRCGKTTEGFIKNRANKPAQVTR